MDSRLMNLAAELYIILCVDGLARWHAARYPALSFEICRYMALGDLGIKPVELWAELSRP
jgi:hypothetical protein